MSAADRRAGPAAPLSGPADQWAYPADSWASPADQWASPADQRASSSVRLARIRPPSLPTSLVSRRHLDEWAARVLAVPTTVVQAPAGYGKTTLLAQLSQALKRDGRNVYWLSIVASDREPDSLLTALAASCGLPELPRADSTERRLSCLANWLAHANEPGCILLDDADRLTASPSGRLLHELVEAIPAGFHVVCTGRAAPELPSARERGYGRLFELGAGDLSFSTAEVDELLGVLGIGALGEAELERFLRRSEGWPMVVRSECVALAAADGAHALDRLTGKRHDIAAFFEAEVVRNERPEMILVLEAAAIAEQTNGAMATALTGLENAHALLDEACERGLFVTPIDESRQCYRVHRLFSDALRQRLERRSPSHERELHRRASEWYERSGSLVEAVDHAVQGGDAARAARIFDAHSEEFMETGHESAILTVANRIPAGLQLRHPRLLLAMSWRLLAEWQFERARTLLARAQARIDEMSAQGDCEPSELGELRHQLLHGQVMLAQFSDDLSFIERHTEGLLRSPSEMSPYVRGSLHAALLFAAREQFRLARIDSLEILARQQFQVVSSRYVTIFLEGIIAPGNLMRGRTASVITTLTEALRTALEVGGPTLAPMVALALAEAHYDRGELEASLALLDTHLPQARVIGFADQLIAGCTTRARIARLRGERAVALRVLEETIQFARERSFEKLLVMLTAEHIDVLCRFGETAEAARLAAKIGLRRAADSVMPRPRVTRAKAALAYAWTSLAQAQGRCSEAIKVARKWRNMIEAAGAVRDALRWSVRLAVLLRRAGDEIGARRELHRAIGVADPAGLMQLLVEETEALGEGLAGELVALGAGWTAPVGPAATPGARAPKSPAGRVGVNNLTSPAAGGIASRMPGGSLTPREVEILTLVGEGLSNAEIGHRLSLVEGSVKWHLQRIYDKIGTRRRLVAVDRARRLGVFR
jgi:LuxR family transcriptional regulator, maltose regulon positive regulatory protein